jgi:type IV pilus assembly protein PilB
MASYSSQPDELKKILVASGAVTSEELKKAVTESEDHRQTFLRRLVRTGTFDARKLLRVLCNYFGYPPVNPAIFSIDKNILNLIPAQVAANHFVLPISRHENTLTVAFADPTDIDAVNDLNAITKMRIKMAVADAKILRQVIESCYPPEPLAPESKPDGDSELQMDHLAQQIQFERESDNTPDQQTLLKEALETPVVKLVNSVMIEGIRRRASDIFVEPWEKYIRIRARVDGLLEEIVRPQKSLGNAIVSRIKIMSDLDIAEHRVPQDGRFKIKVKNREVDMRVSILPTSFGEKACLRILDTTSQSHDISRLGFSEREQVIIQNAARRPHGMILVTGPTGSGKTTTLYSVLKYLDAPDVNITTVEDPVEYQLPGINQVNVRETIGLTFPAALRSILRQDPDIILIGEIRDAPTLDIAVKAALTGHLVLSTLHTNDAASSVTRMVNMGMEPFLIASTVIMISAQRLVRRLCPQCKVIDELPPHLLQKLGFDPMQPPTFYRSKGCSQCRQTGYKGRTVVTEIFQMTPAIRTLINQGSTAEQIKIAAQREGMTTLYHSALRKATEGETTLEEVFRVTSDDKARAENEKNGPEGEGHPHA